MNASIVSNTKTLSASACKAPALARDEAGTRILAEGVRQSNDTRRTGMNNNDLIIGPTGAGKTRGYVIPNLLHDLSESFIVIDTKGNLHAKYAEYLRGQGYETQCLDFVDCLHSEHGFNPLQFIERDERTGRCNEQDILRLAAAMCPVQLKNDPYWDQAAQMTLASLIGLTLERFMLKDQNMHAVTTLAMHLGSDWIEELFMDLATSDPESFAAREHRMTTINKDADKMVASVAGILINALQPMSFEGAKHLFTARKQVDFAGLGRRRTALFVTVSDNDRALDRLVNVFFAQALQELVRAADRRRDNALEVPVRLIMDDFAANAVIPCFDKIITTIRSRGIAVSLIVQDLTQLNAMYGDAVGTIIANNCDTWLYLGGQDVGTAEKLSKKLRKPIDSVLELGLDEAFLFRRGSKPLRVQKYDLASDCIERFIVSEDARCALEPVVEGGIGLEGPCAA